MGARGSELLNESLSLWRAVGNRQRVANVLGNLGWYALIRKDFAKARPLFEQTLAIARDLRDSYRICSYACQPGARRDALRSRGVSTRASSRDSRPAPGARRKTRPARGARCRGGARACTRRLPPRREARWSGRASSRGRRTHLDGPRVRDPRPLRRPGCEQVGGETFDAAWAEGRGLTFDEAIAYALAM